jgi:hypothetical protein
MYFMRTKDEVFSRFQEFKPLVENATKRKIKVMGSNNGGEYIGKAFKEFYAQAGIKKELPIPYNPQQNGVVEWKNKAIVGASIAMLYDQDLPKFLWVEACNTAVYIQNRGPHKVLRRLTHEEAFTRKKLGVGHFRIFCCLVYCHVPSDKRTKLDSTAKKGILVGYSETSKAYRVYVPALKKTMFKRDVRFKEKKAFRKSCDVQAAAGDQELATPKEEQESQVQVTGTGTCIGTSTRAVEQDEEQEAPPTKIVPPTTGRKRNREVSQTLRDAQKFVGAPRTSVRRSRAPQRYLGYMALMSDLIDREPSNFPNVSKQQVWQDAMVEEHASIMKNDVWEVV